MAKKGYKRTITLDFNYDSVKKAVPDINRAIGELNTNFRANAAEADAAGKKVDKLGLQYDHAKMSIELNAKKVDILTKELKELENAENKNEKAISRKKKELDNAKKSMHEAASEMNKLNKEIQANSGFLGSSVEKWKSFGDKMTDIGKSLTTKVTVPILAMGAGAVKMASDMQENVNKVNEVFKGNAETIHQWASNSIESMGLAKSSALEMVSLYGDMATSMGLTNDEATKMSTSMVQLAADLSSFKNVKIEVAQTALSGIFTGETESLKKLGIVMTEANLQQFAYTQGIRKKVSEMTQAEKVELRYQYVMENTKTAHGDFARTGGTAANQARVFKESLKELGASMGEVVLPTFTEILKGVNAFLKVITDMPTPIKEVIVIMAGIAAVAGPLVLTIGSLAKAVVAVNSAYILFAGKTAIVNAGLLSTSATAPLAAGGITAVGTASAGAAISVNTLIAGFLLAVGTIMIVVNAIKILVEWYQKWKNASKDVEKTAIKPKTVGQQYYSARVTGLAIGTSYSNAGRTRLHEYGDEIIDLPKGSRVYTAEQSRQMMNDTKNDGETSDLLKTLIGRVDALTSTVKYLPDRQILLARE